MELENLKSHIISVIGKCENDLQRLENDDNNQASYITGKSESLSDLLVWIKANNL